MIRFFTAVTAFVFLTSSLKSQTQSDTIFNYITKTPVTIDGQATEECWTNAEWHAIDQVWIPYAQVMPQGDFAGKFKVSWDESYLYVLVEVVDDMLSDDHSSPTDNWYNDDCLEVFIDENRSKGDHEKNNNAFAYHVSLFYDAIDLNSSGNPVNYKNNLQVDMDTIGANTYLWEFAIKNYSSSFSTSNPEASRVALTANKMMGFAIAYCDNDQTQVRENFIGSMEMASATANDMYKNADYFGPMKLIDPTLVSITPDENRKQTEVTVYPVPTKDWLTIEISSVNFTRNSATISSITGQIIKNETFTERSHSFDLNGIKAGMYLLEVKVDGRSYSKMIVKE
jgi:hypothetical protein